MVQQAEFETIRTTAFGSITGSFLAIGTPLAHPARIICFTNDTDQAVYFSTDGTNNMIYLPKNSFKLFDLTTNRVSADNTFAIPQQTQFYVKYASAPGSGAVFIEVMYGN